MRVLERKLIKEHKETVRAKALRSRDAIERAEMEDFFTQCIEVCGFVKFAAFTKVNAKFTSCAIQLRASEGLKNGCTRFVEDLM